MPAHKKYTPELSQRLMKLYETMTAREIAAELRMSEGAISAALFDLGARKTYRSYHKTKPMNLKPTQLAYLAGIIDGEGTVTLKRHSKKLKPIISITNTAPLLGEWLLRYLPGPGTYLIPYDRRGNGYYSFLILGMSFLPLYEALLPYMVIKKDRMQLIIEWSNLRLDQYKAESYLPRHIEIMEEIRYLNLKPSSRLKLQT